MSEANAVSTKWTEEQDNFIRANYRSHRAAVIAEALNKTKNAVIGRAHRLGLGKPYDEVFGFNVRQLPVMKRKAEMAEVIPTEPTNDNDYLSRNLLQIVRQRGETNQRRKPAMLKEQEVKDPVQPLNGKGVSLWDIAPHQCRWVVGDPKGMMFCGHDKQEGSSYCQSHYDLSRGKGKC